MTWEPRGMSSPMTGAPGISPAGNLAGTIPVINVQPGMRLQQAAPG